jgi:foldase protein PrsA
MSWKPNPRKDKIVKRILLLIVSLLAVALAACSQETTPEPSPTPLPTLIPLTGPTAEPGGIEVALGLVIIPDQETIAVVNEEEVPTADYQAELTQALHMITNQYMVDWNDPESQSFLPALQEQTLDQLIERVLLWQLAGQEKITVSSEEIEDQIALLQVEIQQSGDYADWESFLTASGLTEESIRHLIATSLLADAMAERHGGPKVVEQVHASHILVETEETGQEVLDKLAAGDDFASLAAEYSLDPGSKDQGGDLGWFPRGMMVPEFEEAAFSLQPDETSDLVQSDFGYHIIRVHEKEEREIDPVLYAQMSQQEFQVWFEEQKAAADIERLYTFEISQ